MKPKYIQCHLRNKNKNRISWVKEKIAKVNEIVIDVVTEVPWKIVKIYGKELSENVIGCKIN